MIRAFLTPFDYSEVIDQYGVDTEALHTSWEAHVARFREAQKVSVLEMDQAILLEVIPQ